MSNDNWMSPEWLIEGARLVLGGIDLDPCTSLEANQRVQATNYVVPPANGLDLAWEAYSSVYCNPPFSQAARWVDKAIKSDVPTVFICNNSTSSRYGQRLLEHSDCVYFPDKRVGFLDDKGVPCRANANAQMFCLLHATSYQALRIFPDVFHSGVTMFSTSASIT